MPSAMLKRNGTFTEEIGSNPKSPAGVVAPTPSMSPYISDKHMLVYQKLYCEE